MTKVLYTGSFDPITKGHENIIKQASELFDEVIVAILKNPKKPNGFFTVEERLEILKKIYATCENIKVIIGSGAAVDVATLHKCKAIVRGLRGLTDFDYEIGMAGINKEISNGEINTICLFADNNYQNISSSMVKEVFTLGKPISRYVSPVVEEAMNEKYEIIETEQGPILSLRRKEI
ncbi:MAG: pantetheine-phosphate adenylyltransferase [Firmicutes bacterium]|nr:pantetheine-phosphate adenylyltransferase [Bacillota bacterium]